MFYLQMIVILFTSGFSTIMLVKTILDLVSRVSLNDSVSGQKINTHFKLIFSNNTVFINDIFIFRGL